LNADGTILQVNLTGASLLGVERSSLTGKQFRIYIENELYFFFKTFFSKTFEGETAENCELRLLQKDGAQSRTVQLEARLSEDTKECNLVMIDVTKRNLSKKENTENIH
jgi:PAS domain S-box-containing protein